MLVLALVSAGAVVTGGRSIAHASVPPAEALLVGDSVLNGLAQPYGAPGRIALGARHSFVLDSAGCRRLITTSCRIPPSPAPTNALTVVRARAGQYDRALVVAAGYDDPASGPFGIGAAVDVLVAEAHRQGVEHVIWLNYREAGSAGNVSRFRAANAVLRAKQAQYPELLIGDWAGRSAVMPSGWFSADGIHLGAQAAAAMADLIGDVLDQLPAVVVLPTRCTDDVSSGSMPPTGTPAPTMPVPGGLQLLAAPERFLDTRDLPGELGAGRMLTLPVAGVGGVPEDATAVVLSVVAVEPCADTFLTLFPCGGAPPTTSVVNAVARSIVANSAVVRLGGGAVCVYSLEAADVVVDVSGWIGPAGATSLVQGSTPVAPIRLVDTRPGQVQALHVAQQVVHAGQLLTVDVGALPGIDPSATAATVNVTAAAPRGPGFLTVLPGPCASVALPPPTSTVNVVAGRDVAVSATVGLGNDASSGSRELCIYASVDTDVVVDLQALHGPSGAPVTAVDPRRLVDTRESHRLAAGQSLPIDVGASARGAIVDLVAVAPSGPGFLTVHPCGGSVPTVSNLNVTAGVVVANRAIAPTDETGRFCVFSSVDTDLVVDLEAVIGAG